MHNLVIVNFICFSERTVGLLERPYDILQQWGKHKDEVKFYVQYAPAPVEKPSAPVDNPPAPVVTNKTAETTEDKKDSSELPTDGQFCFHPTVLKAPNKRGLCRYYFFFLFRLENVCCGYSLEVPH